MLVAGPGFGKTILCEQWAPRDGRVIGWFRARRSAADVSVVARALVGAADAVVPGAGSRLLQRLAVTDDPEREAVLLAEMLAEDLDDWPDEGWIVIDDYQHLAASRASETFVETVVAGAPVQMLISSEARPSWISARAILAGEVLEVPEGALAMDSDEVDEVLADARIEVGPGLVALARGWPAVIGLAGMTPDAGDADAELPETLYDFFAEELYRGLDPDLRKGLAILAEMPLLDRELAATLLGEEYANEACDRALGLGILDARGEHLEFHPLLGAFLQVRSKQQPEVSSSQVLKHALAQYRIRGELDAAFDLTEKIGPPGVVDRLVSESMDELLDRARLRTLELWVSRAISGGSETTGVLLAQAEIALRQGRHLTAQGLSERVSRNDPKSSAYRAYLIGAKAAHVGTREKEALALYRQAGESATDEMERRLAKWGQLTATTELELDESHELLRELEQSMSGGLDANELVQAVGKRLLLELRFGAVQSLAEAKKLKELLPSVSDPVLRCSFSSTFSCALNLAADYVHALEVATEMNRDAAEFRVEFAMPYGFLMRAAALAGLRRFDEAHKALSESMAHAVRCTDTFGQQAVYAGRIRALLHEGRVAEACALEPPDLRDSLPAMRGEVRASRGLALACMGRLAEAGEIAAELPGTTRAVEPKALHLCIDAIIALKSRDLNLADALRKLTSGAFAAGAVDYVVTSYRASPDLLAALLRDPETVEAAGYVIARASDQALAESMGVDALAALDPVTALSPRERDVYDLVCEGFGNAMIARRLFISEATVKVHVRHVYDKIGIRSRTALALNAASRRTQAAPTAVDTGTGSSEADG